MALSSGVRQAVGAGLGWLAIAGVAVLGALYFTEIREAARSAAGLAAPGQPRIAEHKGARERASATPRVGVVGRVVEIKAGSLGHYRAQAEINGSQVDVLVDSGASMVVLSHEDAERAGIYIRDSDYTQRVSTANGVTRVAPVVLDRVGIGDITVRNVEAAVSEPGKLGQSLLGMTFLGRLQRVDMRAGVLVLQE